ncbi:hypothetical protein DJ568_01955 [Mucilaginibacter hurinus]|uniref:Glycosyltransferase subfamily 4-like N-terminal domain-containing protein n=1 Tax=Mucilaginibacter hurinus TaxID=2201324 RepID=A0A367GTY9_9SPHI|nr:glycosyltransferase family 4 protein [Mucilaginibacter hurinus]RCH56648.1 hypothetical protein DJ568_01955 [Mucilaginibacter hurinus]
MKIVYVTSSEIPSRAAHTVHVMKISEAFVKNGHTLSLIMPVKNSEHATSAEIFKFYNVAPVFKIIPFLFYKIKGYSIINPVRMVLLIKKEKPAIVVCRAIGVAIYATLLGVKVIYDAHNNPERFVGYRSYLLRRFYKSKNLIKLTVVTETLKQLFIKEGIAASKLYIVPNGTNEVTDHTKIDAIANSGKLNIGYTGHLYPGKGMEVIAKVAPHLPEVLFHIVGGRDEDIKMWQDKMKLDNVIFHGFIQQHALSSYLNSFDICVLPNLKSVSTMNNEDIGNITCPLKMFEYMAHKKPMIASDLPVLREVLNETNAVLCNPENPQEWVDAIKSLQENIDLRQSLANNAYELFKANYTWQKRAQKLVDGINSI